MKHFLRRKRLQRLRKSLVGKTFVEIKNGRGITHRILWVSQSRFGDKPVRVGIKSSNRTAVRWVPHPTFEAASHRAVYGFECRRRQKVADLAQAERRQPLSVGRESVPDVPAVAESKVGQVAALIDYR
jgi:hypothetical protein